MVATVAGIHLGLDTHANRPAANTAPDGSFYSCSTHSLIYKSNFAGNSWATWATLGGGAPAAHAASHESGGSDEIDATGLVGVGGGGELYGIGPADRVPGSPHADDNEFDTPDASDPMTGWTTLGAPTAHDVDTTAPHHYFVSKAAGGLAMSGIYKACPSFPFTVTAKMSGDNCQGDNQSRAGLFVAEAVPGKMLGLFRVRHDLFHCDIWASPSSFSSTPSQVNFHASYVYWRMIVTSSTSVTTQISRDGFTWMTLSSALNPSMTIASVGLCVGPASAGFTQAAIFDWIRFS